MHEETVKSRTTADGATETERTVKRYGSGLSEFCLAITAITLSGIFLMMAHSGLQQHNYQNYDNQTNNQTR